MSSRSVKKELCFMVFSSVILAHSTGLAFWSENSQMPQTSTSKTKYSTFNNPQNDQYEEVTYDDLVQELSLKKKTTKTNASRYNSNGDQMLMHAGIGVVNSQNTLEFNGRQNFRSWNGVQISMGIDTSNPNWATLFQIRTFAPSRSGFETRSAQELGASMVFHNKFNSQLGARAGGGLSLRQIRLLDGTDNVNINDTTPMASISAGLDLYLATSASIGIEAGARNAFMADTADKSSSDLTIRLDAYF